MSFVAMTQRHCDASIVTKKRSDSSILSNIDDRLQRVINRTRSIADMHTQEDGISKRIRSNLGRKRASMGSPNHQPLPADTNFNLIEDTLRRDPSGRRVITPPAVRSFQDGDDVSISDFPTPPGHHHHDQEPEREARRSDEHTLIDADNNGATENLEPLLDSNADESSAIGSIDLMIASYPDLQCELNVVKRAIREHENEIKASKDGAVGQLHQKLIDALTKIESLQQFVNEKDVMLNDVCDKLDAYDDHFEQSAHFVETSRVKVQWLEDEVRRLEGITTRTQREHAQEKSNHERAKRRILDEYEDKLMAEKLKAEEIQQERERALSFSDSVKESHTLYRNYYNQQHRLYRTYFGQYGQERGVMAAETGMGGILSIPAISEDFTEDGDGRDENMSKSSAAAYFCESERLPKQMLRTLTR